MHSSIASPPVLTLFEYTMPASEMMATSHVPPPMSTIMLAVGSVTGSPTPMAAAIGSSMRCTSRAPAWRVASSTARFSTSVMSPGTAMMTRGLTSLVVRARRMK